MEENVRRHVTPAGGPAPPPHPFARELARESAGRVLLLGAGNGRNVTPFATAGVPLDVVEADPERARAVATRFAASAGVRVARAPYVGPYPFDGGAYAAALSTSALLHGTRDDVARAIAAVRARLAPGARFFCTLGSARDPRYGRGRRVAEGAFAPDAGAEAGVAHAYFDEPRLRAALTGFALDDVREGSAAETAGRWTHAAAETAAIVHWFVRATRQ